MLLEPHKNSPITTDQSWYTPHKHKNVSNIETNPSINVIQSHQYSSIELSESLAESPSFLSPNKQLGSFLMTPNYSSKQMLSAVSQSIGDMRLKTQSLVETSHFYDMTGESKKTLPETSSNEAKELLKMINQIRQIKAKKTFHSRKLNAEMVIQSFLVKEISRKEQSILAHKLIVEEKIKDKNKLQKRLKQKKTRIKAKTNNFLHQLQAKVNKLRQQLDTTYNLLNLDQMAIGRYQNELYQINHYMQQKGHGTNPPYFTYQNQGEPQMLQSKAQQMNYQQIPGFYSNPSSSRSHQTNMKKSSEEIQKSGQQKSANSSNLSIQDILKNHFSSMMGKGQMNQQKLRKFSFGQNPSFCMEGLENKHGSGKKIQHQNENNVTGNNGNFIMQALAMRVNQLAGDNTRENPQSISPQKRFHQNSGPFITQQFDSISPIASAKRVRFGNGIAQRQVKQDLFQKNQLSSNKKDFGQIIQQLDGKQDQSQCQLQYYNQSVIDINEDPMVESKYKNSPRLNFNRKQSESPQHKRTLSGQTGKKSIKLPLVLQQSIVQIACQSSTCSDNLQRHDFSPRKEEIEVRRLRSPTHQVMPAIHEEIHDLRKTENRLKGSNREVGSSKHSGGGAETPIFRSEASQDQQIGFSRPFLGGSMKESQIIDQQPHQFEANKSSKKPQQPSYQPEHQQQQQRAYRTTVLTQSKKSQPYSIYQTQNMRTIQTDQQQPIEQKNQDSDDDFYSCTLRTESKVFVEGTAKSREVEDQVKSHQVQGDSKVMSSRARYNGGNGQRKDVIENKGKEMNLVLENVKNKNYDMSLNLSELGNRNYDSKEKRLPLDLNKKGASVELERSHNDISDSSIERNQREFSQRANNQSMSTL